MLATDNFLFLHLHKSGGTFINQAIKQFMPNAKELGYHLPYEFLPAGYDHLPVVGVVRNPWDFYVSLYHFQALSPRPNVIFQVFSENGTCDTQQTIANMASPKDRHFELLEQRLPDDFVDRGVNLTKNCARKLSVMSGGWYSRLFRRMYAGANPYFMQVENLRDDFLFVIDLYGEKTTAEFDDYVLNSPKKNTSDHKHYSAYYNDELRQLVAEMDAGLIEQFNYSFQVAR